MAYTPTRVTQGKLAADLGQNFEQPFLGYDHCVAVAQENPALAPAILGGKGDVRHDDVVGFDPEAFPLVGPAEGAFVA